MNFKICNVGSIICLFLILYTDSEECQQNKHIMLTVKRHNEIKNIYFIILQF